MGKNLMRTELGALAVVMLVVGIGAGQNGGVSSGYPTPRGNFTVSQQRGHGLYLRYCVGCHGTFGDGNGENAPYIDPKPRDFVTATFKCRSTPTGTLPTDADLINTLHRGVEASNMTLIWLGSLYGSKLRITAASLFALGFISMFVSGGVSGFFLAQPSIDIYLHATTFVVGHFHMVMGVAAIFGIFAGTYFWFPKMTGRMMSEKLGKLHFWLTFVGTYCIFMPFHYLGLAGNVRRYAVLVDDYLIPLIPVHRFITIAALFTGAAQFIFLYNLIQSRFWGEAAPANPWECTSLEWSMVKPRAVFVD